MLLKPCSLVLLLASMTGCASSSSRRTPVGSRPPPPVMCTDTAFGRQVTVTCRYYETAQAPVVWEQMLDRAALAAVATGLSHVQFLSVDVRQETVKYAIPLDCRTQWGGQECTGGGAVDVPVALLAIHQLALLSADEAGSRASDPLVPPERRPIDARARLTSRGGQPTAISAGPYR